MKNLLSAVFCLLFLLPYSNLSAQTSNLSIQGVLRNANGTAVENGQYTIAFKLYLSETSSDTIWTETIENVDVEGGIYSVVLGSGNRALDAPFDKPYFLGVSVEGGTELIPRTRLTSSPYALSLIGDDNVFPNSGNVGVGAAYPSSKLTIAREGNTLGLDVDSIGSNSAQIISKTDGLKFSTAGEAYYFEGDITEVMRIKKDGKVGIGTDDPQSTLHVIGDDDQLKIEGTDNARLTFTKSAAAASVGFDATNGNSLMLTNNAGEVNVIGTKVSLNPSTGEVDINGSLKANDVAEITKDGEALKLIGDSNVKLSFYPTGIASGLKGNIGVESNGQLLINSTSSDIVLEPASGERVQTKGMLYATGYETVNVPQSDHIYERYTSSSYATRRNSTNYSLSIYASKGVRAHFFVIASDKRIKKDFRLSDGQKDLSTLSKIEVTDYRHIDELANGKESRKGLIAQQVKSVFPEAITETTNFIPNVFDFPSALSLENGNLKIRLNKEHDFEVGQKIKLSTLDGNQEVIVSTINSPQEFSIENWKGSTNKEEFFVYGKEVNDFQTVDYDRVFTLALSATQELARKIEVLKKENARLKKENERQLKSNSILKAEVDLTSSRLQNIESLLNITSSN